MDGLIEASGAVFWTPALDWKADITLDAVDPGVLRADFPGRIGGRLSLDGGLTEHGVLNLDADIAGLQGELRGQALRISGAMQMRGDRLIARDLPIASGENRILVDGAVEQDIDLRVGINAPDLSGLYPGLSGRLNGTGNVSGTRENPAVTAALDGEGLQFEEYQVAGLEIRADWQQQGGTASLRLDEALLAGQALTTLRLDLDGKPDAHRLSLELDGAELAASLAAQGGLQGNRWNGRLEQLRVAQDAVGEWRLAAPAALDLGAERASIDRLCLAQDAQRL